MSGVRYAAFNRCYRLFVGRVRMAHRSNDAVVRGTLNQFERTGKLRRERDNANKAVRGGEKFLEELLRRWHDGVERMHAAPDGVDERPFQVDSQDFGCKSRIRISRAADVTRNAVQAFADLFGWRGHSSRDERRSAPSRDRGRNLGDRLGRAFHHVMAAGTVNVHIHESGNDNLVASCKVFRIVRNADLIAMPYLGDFGVFNDDDTIEYFFVGSEDAAGVDGGRGHGSIMLPELRAKNTAEPCILFLLRYNHGARKFKRNRNGQVRRKLNGI